MQNNLEKRNIAIIGFRDPLREVINNALNQHFIIDTVTDDLSLIASLAHDTVLVCHADWFKSLSIDSISVIRKRFFIWNPIIVIERSPNNVDEDTMWNVCRLTPPLNVSLLVKHITQAISFPDNRQVEVLTSALYQLREDLLYLHQLENGNTHIDDNKVRKDVAETLTLLKNVGKVANNKEFTDLSETANDLLALPTLDEAALQVILPLVVNADSKAREIDLPALLRSKMHQLSNTVRLALYHANDSSSTRIGDLYDLLSVLPIQQIDTFSHDLVEPLISLRNKFFEIVHDKTDITENFNATQLDELPFQCATLISKLLMPSVPLSASVIKRIVVIEDDPGWQTQILSVLATIGLTIPIQSASTIEEGERLLKESENGTLALVDLGLPLNEKDAKKGLTDLDGGLKLLKICAKNPNLGIRAIVLTAAENFADAVRDALASGVDAADYIQKDPRNWEEQLRSRVQLAVQSPTPTHLPVVDVLQCTARLIRVDGVEIALERRPYILFEYLAKYARIPRKITYIRQALTTPGDRDITPAMSKEQQKSLLAGDDISPYDLLTPKHLQDYLYDLRKQIENGLDGLGITHDYSNLITYHPDSEAYCLNADIRMVEQFEQLSKTAELRKVLIIEDHPQWYETLSNHLKSLGFDVKAVKTLDDAKQAIDEWAPHNVTLDLQIPRNNDELQAGIQPHEENGIAVMRYLKEHLPDTGIIVISSIDWKDSVMLEMLRAGIAPHDYISKQWDDALNRVAQSIWRLTIRRENGSQINPGMSPGTIAYINIDEVADTIEIAGCQVKLYPDGKKILKMLAKSPNMPVQRDTIVDMLWPNPDLIPDDFDGLINTIISRLRKSISDSTQGKVEGKQLIRNADGVYWLQGIISYKE